MKPHEIEERFIDLVEKTLPPGEDEALRAEIAKNPALARAFSEYESIVATEKLIASESHAAHPSLDVKIMQQVEAQSSASGFIQRFIQKLWRWCMDFSSTQRRIGASIAMLACVVIVLRVSMTGVYNERSASPSASPEGLVIQEQKIGGERAVKSELHDGLMPPSKIIASAEGAPTVAQEMAQEKTPASIIARGIDALAPNPVLGERSKEEAADREQGSITAPVDERTITMSKSARHKGPPSGGENSAPGAKESFNDLITAFKADVATLKNEVNEMKDTGDKKEAEEASTRMVEVLKTVLSRMEEKNAANRSAQSVTIAASEKDIPSRMDEKERASGSAPSGVIAAQEVDFSRSGVSTPTAKAKSAGSVKVGVDGKVLEYVDSGKKPVLSNELSAPKVNFAKDNFAAHDSSYFEEQPINTRTSALLARQFSAAPGTESYTSYTENPRTLVRDEALSTFSIDVDSASYANARRFINTGTLPPQDSVRIEEFVNYFDYNYPQQREKPFTVSYEMAPAPYDEGRFLLKLGIKARDAAQSEKGWNLVFLVDVSGSMDESNKLALLKKALPRLVQKMRPEDRLAIVTYAGDAGVALESTVGTQKERILEAIDGLHAGGSTHGSAGIRLAYEIARKNFKEGSVNRVVLATDGDFNVGTVSHEELFNLIEEQRRSGVTLTVLGVGSGNLKDSMMEQLADKGNGNYFYLDSFKEARKVLETDLAGNMEVVAKDVKLQIEFNPQHVYEYRLIGYDNRKLDKHDFANDQVDAGEIGAGHTVTALYEIVLSDSELARKLTLEYRYRNKSEVKEEPRQADNGFASELAFLKVRFKKPESNTSELLQFPIETSVTKKSFKDASSDFRFAAAVADFAALLRGSQYAGSYTFKDIIELAQQARGEDPHGYRQEFIELVKDASAIRRK